MTYQQPTGQRVKFVRWPAQEHLRDWCRENSLPCLMVVEMGARPPACIDPREDWVRTPISRVDLEARVSVLQRRTSGAILPAVDFDGTLRYRNKTITVSDTQAKLLACLIKNFGKLTVRSELNETIADAEDNGQSGRSRNSLDLHIMRLRRRVWGVDLGIRTVWGRGYALEPQHD